jgi:hypothetical protein
MLHDVTMEALLKRKQAVSDERENNFLPAILKPGLLEFTGA